MAEILGVGHIQVYTKDLQKSLCFYEKLGGKVRQYEEVHRSDRVIHMAMVNLGHAAIELSERPEYRTPDRALLPCIGHICLETDDIYGLTAELRAQGVDSFDTAEVQALAFWGGILSIFLTGPSGERIELMQRKSCGYSRLQSS